MPHSHPRRLLERLYRAALEAADPEPAVRLAMGSPAVRRALADARAVGVFAVGKAAAAMARGARVRSARRLVVIPRGAPAPGLARREIRFAGHPEPDASSVAAARRALEFFASFGPRDVLLCLVSGGASALLALPREGLTLADKRRAVRELARSGAPIAEVNRLRTQLSAVKGGRLGRSTRARLITLVLSDVSGDDPRLVGSGPTICGRRGDLVRVVATNRSALEAAAREARRMGLRVGGRRPRLAGEARVAGERIAREALRLSRGGVILAGGETTVVLGPRAGAGGRCLELALGAARVLAGAHGVHLLSAGSDGRDGSSRAAGAFADARTLSRARRLGLDRLRALRRHATEPFFDALGDLFVTGPTGTNVGDWVFALREPVS